MSDDGLPCSRCPVRDVGERYPVNDPRDPWRRMPRLFEQMRDTFGRPMYNVQSRVRRDSDERVSLYCRRTRAVHGDDCSVQRMRLCCSSLHAVAERSGRADNPYAAWRWGMERLLSDDRLYGQLHRTRDHSYVVDLGAVLGALEHCD